MPTRRGTATPVHRPQRPAGSTHAWHCPFCRFVSNLPGARRHLPASGRNRGLPLRRRRGQGLGLRGKAGGGARVTAGPKRPHLSVLPPPSLYHPSGSSQCTSPKHPVSCIESGLAIHFIYDIIHVSMPVRVCSVDPILCVPMDYSPPGSSVRGDFQARILAPSPSCQPPRGIRLSALHHPSTRGRTMPGLTPAHLVGSGEAQWVALVPLNPLATSPSSKHQGL